MIQGDPEAPKQFNLLLDDAINDFEQRCLKECWGYPLDICDCLVDEFDGAAPAKKRRGDCRSRLAILVYADNYQIFVSSLKMLPQMTETW